MERENSELEKATRELGALATKELVAELRASAEEFGRWLVRMADRDRVLQTDRAMLEAQPFIFLNGVACSCVFEPLVSGLYTCRSHAALFWVGPSALRVDARRRARTTNAEFWSAERGGDTEWRAEYMVEPVLPKNEGEER